VDRAATFGLTKTRNAATLKSPRLGLPCGMERRSPAIHPTSQKMVRALTAKPPASSTMGPDFASQQTRTAGNLKRVFQSKTSQTSDKMYITVSYKNINSICYQTIESKAVGGYAWTYNGWLAYYHYITLCPTFFYLDTLDTNINDVRQELASDSTRMAKDMTWLRSTGQFFLHEMMHTRIASGSVELYIIDEYVAPIPGGEIHDTNDLRAYGPKLVHLLATRSLKQGGGATRASTNAYS